MYETDMSSNDATICNLNPIAFQGPQIQFIWITESYIKTSWKSDPEDYCRSQIQFYCKWSFTPLKIKSTPTNKIF